MSAANLTMTPSKRNCFPNTRQGLRRSNGLSAVGRSRSGFQKRRGRAQDGRARSIRMLPRDLKSMGRISAGSGTSRMSPSEPASSVPPSSRTPGRARSWGYKRGRNIDVRLAAAALKAATASRRRLRGCGFHTDRGAQHPAPRHRRIRAWDFIGSMSRRGNPCDVAKAGKLHEGAEGRDGPCERTRNLPRPCGGSAEFHGQRLQRHPAAFRARLPEPQPVRRKKRLATVKTSGLTGLNQEARSGSMGSR